MPIREIVIDYTPTIEYEESLADMALLCDDNPFIDIFGWEGKYAISPRGEVYSYKSHQIMKPIKSSTGYLVVNLKSNGRCEQRFIHRLVAEAFIPNPYGDLRGVVNHIDEDPTNNWAINLEWCTTLHNSNYGSAKFKRSESQLNNPIIGVNPTGEVYEFRGQAEAARKTKIQQANIGKVLYGERSKDYTNYAWELNGCLSDEELEMCRQALLEDTRH